MLAVHERQTVSRPSSRGADTPPTYILRRRGRSMETSLYDEYKEKYNKEGILELHKGKLMKNLEKKVRSGRSKPACKSFVSENIPLAHKKIDSLLHLPTPPHSLMPDIIFCNIFFRFSQIPRQSSPVFLFIYFAFLGGWKGREVVYEKLKIYIIRILYLFCSFSFVPFVKKCKSGWEEG